jgi:N-acetylglucosaminyldiphosphoundecaprenol N-acetyl-beta-D-mannosaminyltransferase
MYKIINKIWNLPLDFDESFERKFLINTVNANAFNVSQKDPEFYQALLKSDILLPDGVGALIAGRFLSGLKLKKISGYDLFIYEMAQLNQSGGRCFFLGSSENVLNLIRLRAGSEYQNVKIGSYSPPYKPVFSNEENKSMLVAINSFSPDVLFVGMTAPKQEKWAAEHFDEINAKHICCIGAVFDFYAGRIKRAPQWMIRFGLEWFYRLIKEPKRMWRRYIVGNSQFLWLVLKEKIKGRSG